MLLVVLIIVFMASKKSFQTMSVEFFTSFLSQNLFLSLEKNHTLLFVQLCPTVCKPEAVGQGLQLGQAKTKREADFYKLVKKGKCNSSLSKSAHILVSLLLKFSLLFSTSQNIEKLKERRACWSCSVRLSTLLAWELEKARSFCIQTSKGESKRELECQLSSYLPSTHYHP